LFEVASVSPIPFSEKKVKSQNLKYYVKFY
jgi:hypothetical protein